ncbi:MAG TPA: hypothetical protein VI298_04210 [Geobacteraceae bacterium]
MAALLPVRFHEEVHDQQKRKRRECSLDISPEELPGAEGNDEEGKNNHQERGYFVHEIDSTPEAGAATTVNASGRACFAGKRLLSQLKTWVAPPQIITAREYILESPPRFEYTKPFLSEMKRAGGA